MTKIQPNDVYAAYRAAYMIKHGLGRKGYADVVGVHADTVDRWLSGEIACPQVSQLIRLCKVHRVDPYHPEDLGFPSRGRRYAHLAGRRSPQFGPGTETDVMDLLRRDLLYTTAGVIFGASLGGPIGRILDATAPAANLHVGAADVAAITKAYRQMNVSEAAAGGGALGSKRLMREAENALRILHGHFADDTIRAQAHTAAAQLTHIAGFCFYDLGMQDEARKMWLVSLAVARDAEETAVPFLHASVLSNLAEQSARLGNPQQALDLLHFVSGRERHLSDRMRSMLNIRRAGVMAALGDVAETRRYIAMAEQFADAPMDERDLVWNSREWYYSAEMSADAGHALGWLATRHEALRDEALTRARDALAGFQPGHTVARTRVETRIARLHATRHDVAQTEAAGRAAVASARRLNSPRVVGELAAMQPYLRQMRRHPGIAELDREIGELPRSAT